MNEQGMKRVWLVAICLCLGLGAACRSKAPVIHQGVGVIEEVNHETARVQINHQEIKGYMPAMSMAYRVRDKAILDSVKSGDEVEFTMEDSAAGVFVLAISKKAGNKKEK